jgi:MGT family glycosyltransferase
VPILEDTAARLEGLWAAHGLEVPAYAGCFASGYLDICPHAVQSTSVDHIAHVQPLRPVETAEPVAEPAEPLVYVTLGTVQSNADLLREIVAGVAGLPVHVLVALGPRIPPESLGRQPDHVQVESWVDQPAVLGRTTAVVSHGGSGTFLGALARGLPQLCVPQGADQFRNAEGGARAGAALALGPDELSAASVCAATERLLEDSTLRAAARRVAHEIADMPGPDDVCRLLADRVVESSRPDDPRG